MVFVCPPHAADARAQAQMEAREKRSAITWASYARAPSMLPRMSATILLADPAYGAGVLEGRREAVAAARLDAGQLGRRRRRGAHRGAIGRAGSAGRPAGRRFRLADGEAVVGQRSVELHLHGGRVVGVGV